MVYNDYYKVMSNIPKMGQLPTPGLDAKKTPKQWNHIWNPSYITIDTGMQQNHSNIWTILCRVFLHLDSCANPLYTYFCSYVPSWSLWFSEGFTKDSPRLWPWPLQLGLQLQGHLRIGDCGGSSRDLPGSQSVTMMSPWSAKNTWFIMVFTPSGESRKASMRSLATAAWIPKASWNMTERDGSHIDSHSKSLTSPYQFIARQQLGWFVVCLFFCWFLYVFILCLSCSLASMKNRAILANSFSSSAGRDGWWVMGDTETEDMASAWHLGSIFIYFSVPIHLPRLDIPWK